MICSRKLQGYLKRVSCILLTEKWWFAYHRTDSIMGFLFMINYRNHGQDKMISSKKFLDSKSNSYPFSTEMLLWNMLKNKRKSQTYTFGFLETKNC